MKNLSIMSGILMAGFIHFCFPCNLRSQSTPMSTYCNPVNIDYTYMIYNSHQDISYRSGADPAVVVFRDEYYMFVTRSLGYWHSKDLNNWTFINPEKWYFEGSNAPAAHNYKDSVLFVMGNPSGQMSVLYTDNPIRGDWKIVPSILTGLQDPCLFIDEDDQAYIFWGSSNRFPIRAKTLDTNLRFRPAEETFELISLDPEKNGWERFGENHSDTILKGYIEGPWLNRHKNKYFLQYAAPGTEFNVYADGVYIGDTPLGPYHYAPNNPISYKPGGFINGAGHGSTVMGPAGMYWHFSTMALSVNVKWERRIGMFPTFFDEDGLMYCNTSFGDYPHFVPSFPGKMGQFAGWMLLSYNKPVIASSYHKAFIPENVNDENIKSFWVAGSNDDQQWIEIDLLREGIIRAVQLNYHDYHSDLYGKVPGLFHRYIIEGSVDRENWFVLVDRSNNFKEVPHDYVETEYPMKARYIRYKNIHTPGPWLSISGLRVFGTGSGEPPARARNLKVNRYEDRRDAMITWDKIENCQGYNVKWGIAPDKLYNSWLVYDKNYLELKYLTTDQKYYFAVECFNENGCSPLSETVKAD